MDIQTLLTNDVFPEENLAQLKLERTAASTELALLEAEIALAELDLESESAESPTYNFFIARNRRRNLRALIAACSVATAPQKYLPAELLSYIFQLSFAGYPTDLPPTGRNINPLALCHTCSRWRRIALNTPELWTDVVFRYGRGLDPYTTLDLVEEWYTRSGPSTSLSLGFSPWTYHTYRSDHEEIMQAVLHRLVVPYVHRFRHLKLQLPRAELQSLMTMPNLSFPLLQSLQLVRDPWVKEGHARVKYRPTNGSFCANAPRLTDLEVHNFHISSFMDTRFFPWTRLTRFFSDNTHMSVSQSQTILRKCHKIVEFALSLDVMSRGNEQAPVLIPHIELPYLRRFDVTFANEAHSLMRPFFEPLFIPEVKELNIRSVEKMSVWDSAPLMSLLGRSCFDIEILHIWNFHLSGEVVAELVHTLPSLCVLLVGVEHLLPKGTLEEIAKGRLLPKLRSLVCRIDDIETAVQLIENRLAGCELGGTFARPSFFMLDYISRQSITHDQAIRVDRLRENGVEVEITRLCT
ncbi:hypothetical protein M413DRAFT_206149 [Hebeloma cylindrosporum]|uniref:Uncharacterized protein n=1 Tax=Hebeloma cylindrosporum TaxID=76867 RepID=A0A0C2YCZ1_HEBCY|nr:hypothetical protein M413DRAFT_206149 [Hebeloma cylindrosporum h7]